MKILAGLLIISTLLFGSCRNEGKAKIENEQLSSIQFESTVYDFGTIPYSSDGRCYFNFTNDSDQPLIVNVVRTTCGCTRPEWPEQPVQPGEKERIGITYNTKIVGRFQKSITVYSNAENSPVKLFIKGNVESKI
ncbi:MAG: DUF1573 domain-containing protein [Bacteroidales bacterium]